MSHPASILSHRLISETSRVSNHGGWSERALASPCGPHQGLHSSSARGKLSVVTSELKKELWCHYLAMSVIKSMDWDLAILIFLEFSCGAVSLRNKNIFICNSSSVVTESVLRHRGGPGRRESLGIHGGAQELGSDGSLRSPARLTPLWGVGDAQARRGRRASSVKAEGGLPRPPVSTNGSLHGGPRRRGLARGTCSQSWGASVLTGVLLRVHLQPFPLLSLVWTPTTPPVTLPSGRRSSCVWFSWV